MKRWLMRTCVLLVLGAIINVAVAWGINLHQGADDSVYARAWSKNEPASPGDLEWLAANGWAKPVDTKCLRFYVVRNDWSALGYWQRAFKQESELLCPGRHAAYAGPFAVRTSCGWPVSTMSDSLTAYRADGTILVGGFDHAFAFSFGELRQTLPLRPLWAGFAINTVFYAVILWLLFAAPFALRRRRRIKRGLCPKCAYPVGTSAVCTECGAPHAVSA